jgi:prophage antirepressor-like protein
MNGLQVFNYHEKEVRTVMIDNEPWFVAKDVCRILELDNISMSISRLDDDEKGFTSIETPGGKQDMAIVNEAGLYTLIRGGIKSLPNIGITSKCRPLYGDKAYYTTIIC